MQRKSFLTGLGLSLLLPVLLFIPFEPLAKPLVIPRYGFGPARSGVPLRITAGMTKEELLQEAPLVSAQQIPQPLPDKNLTEPDSVIENTPSEISSPGVPALNRLLEELERYPAAGAYRKEDVSEDSFLPVRKLFSKENLTLTDEVMLRRALYAARTGDVEKNLGLRLAGSYMNNVKNGVLEDERGSFDNTMYVGVEWEILKEGWLQRRHDLEMLKLEEGANLILEERFSRRDGFEQLYYRTIYVFNVAKIRKLKQQIDTLSQYIDLAKKLYHYRLVSWEEILKLDQQKADTEKMLAVFSEYNKAYQPVPTISLPDAEKELPVLEIEVYQIVREAEGDDFYDRAIAADREKYGKPNDPLLNVNLRAFARYYRNDMFTSRAGDSTAAGLYVRIPLPFDAGQGEQARTIEQKLSEHNIRKMQIGALYQIQDICYEYGYKLKDFNTFVYKRALIEERLRREDVKRKCNDPSFNPINAMQMLSELNAVEFETLEVKQRLYLKLLELYRLTGPDLMFKNIRMVKETRPPGKYRGERSIYIWSHTFNNQDNEFLFKYLKQQEVRGVMLSLGENTIREKLKTFVARLNGEGITVHALLGDNVMLQQKNRAKLEDRIEEARSLGFTGVHLDVEPHTLPDWRERKSELLADYVSMLKMVRACTVSKKLALTVSIPVFYPAESLTEIYRLTDRVFVMAYEIRDMAIMKKRVREELEAGKEKVVIAIRTKDFAGRLELEDFAGKIVDRLGIEAIAIHDLQGMLELDERHY